MYRRFETVSSTCGVTEENPQEYYGLAANPDRANCFQGIIKMIPLSTVGIDGEMLDTSASSMLT